MKASDNFKIQGYLQLFMAFWPSGCEVLHGDEF